MSDVLRVGLAGLGTVGGGVVELLARNADIITQRCGKRIELVAVSARDATKKRDFPLKDIAWEQDALALAARADVDAVVEVIGGSEGIAKTLAEQTLGNGKHLVTANKALVAHHGAQLAILAEKNHVMLAFEAAVAGGIPIIDTLRNGLAANRFKRVAGILNGTSNYILSTMQKQHRDFSDVLAEAQSKGYAETDPSFDVDGIDAAHKLAIITSLAFGTKVDLASVSIEGIRTITKQDMIYAHELGFTIKLLGLSEVTPQGILQRVHPCLVALDAALGQVDGAYNAIHIESDAAIRTFLEGQGAGAGPTASSIVADLIQIARGDAFHPFTISVDQLKPMQAADMASLMSSYYLCITAQDKPGVLAEITTIFAKEAISVESMIQRTHQLDAPAQIVITTHETKESAMQNALRSIASLASVSESPRMIRIEEL